ncbi:MAG: DNA primase [Parasporobacterium sp.]|nr:DNA primase [Parasporobacterium sp.]
MYYSDDFLDEVRMNSDIVDVISSYVKLKRNGNGYVGLCPFHSEKTPSFHVTPSKQMYYCFGCHDGGSVFTFIQKIENFNFPEAVEFLAKRANMSLPEESNNQKLKQESGIRDQILEINKLAGLYFYNILKSEKGSRGLKYLMDRGLTKETIVSFGLGLSDRYKDDLYRYLKSKGYSDDIISQSGLVKIKESGALDYFWDRVMFPIFNERGNVIAFGGRIMGKGEPKYLNSPETKAFNKRRNLFALNIAKKSKRGNIILCEGYMDVISLHQAGFDNAVASLGTAFTPEQASLIKRYADVVYTSYDSDGAGQSATLKAIDLLRDAGIKSRVIDLKPYKDPDEFIKGEGNESFERRMENARNGFFFVLDVKRNNLNLSDPDEKTEFDNYVCMRLGTIEDVVERENYTSATCKEYGLDERTIREKLSNIGPELQKQKIAKQQREERIVLDRERRNKLSLMDELQNLLITAIVDDASIYTAVSKYISVDDFEGDLYKKIAGKVFEQAKEGNVNAARIIDSINDDEERTAVSGMFNTNALGDGDIEVRQKAITDYVIGIKMKSLEKEIGEVKDFSEIIKLEQTMDEIKKIKNIF